MLGCRAVIVTNGLLSTTSTCPLACTDGAYCDAVALGSGATVTIVVSV